MLEGGLEQTVAHLVSVAVVPWEILELDLALAVAVALLRRESLHGRLESNESINNCNVISNCNMINNCNIINNCIIINNCNI